MKKRLLIAAIFCMMLIPLLAHGDVLRVKADSASAVAIGATDYDDLVMRIYTNGNSVVYMSTDNRKTWNEIDGTADTDDKGAYIDLDISWASPSSDVKLYFKGNTVKTETSCTLPKQDASFKVKFDKINTDFVMTTQGDATTFGWRKSTDYNWTEVPFDTATNEYKEFLATVESLRFKGAKLVFRIAQQKGTNAENMGERPSKEVSVSVTKFATAPTIKVNITKLTFSTKATMEYATDLAAGDWTSCDKAMGVDDLASGAFYTDKGEGKQVTLYFRVAQTEKKAASLISSITIPPQGKGPDAGASGSDVAVAENTTTGKYELKFLTASKENMLEYCVISPEKDFDLNKAKWKTVKAAKTVTLTNKTAPDGTEIYFRFKGTAENVSKNIALKLPSAYVVCKVKWTEQKTAQ